MINYVYGLSWSAYFGRLSYALYVWHYPVQVLCAEFKEDIQRATGIYTDAATFSAQLVFLIALSVPTHHLIENPFRWWRPTRRYLPACCVVALAALLELWLYHLHWRAQDGEMDNLVGERTSPLIGGAELGRYMPPTGHPRCGGPFLRWTGHGLPDGYVHSLIHSLARQVHARSGRIRHLLLC